MMKQEASKYNSIPEKATNPYKAPPGYFESLEGKVMDRIRSAELRDRQNEPRKISLRPYLSLAASISGLALIVYIVVQSISGSVYNEQEAYDLSILETSGIIHDESVLAEYYYEEEEDAYSEWEEDAITYLASNEMDLLYLLESN